MNFTSIGRVKSFRHPRLVNSPFFYDPPIAQLGGQRTIGNPRPKSFTWDDFTDWADDVGIDDGIRTIVQTGINRGTAEVISAIGGQNVGQRILDPRSGLYGVVNVNPNNPTGYVINYENGTQAVYNGQPVVVPNANSSGISTTAIAIGAAALVGIVLLVNK